MHLTTGDVSKAALVMFWRSQEETEKDFKKSPTQADVCGRAPCDASPLHGFTAQNLLTGTLGSC